MCSQKLRYFSFRYEICYHHGYQRRQFRFRIRDRNFGDLAISCHFGRIFASYAHNQLHINLLSKFWYRDSNRWPRVLFTERYFGEYSTLSAKGKINPIPLGLWGTKPCLGVSLFSSKILLLVAQVDWSVKLNSHFFGQWQYPVILVNSDGQKLTKKLVIRPNRLTNYF